MRVRYSLFERVFARKAGAVLLAAFLLTAQIPQLLAADEIQIESLSASQSQPDHYAVSGTVTNTTKEPREIVLRAQLGFFDKTSPKGDIPAAILRKDLTVVLKPGEARTLEVSLINEGKLPAGSLRLEPVLRVRRQRVWNY